MGLPRRWRLRRPAEFQEVFRHGRRIGSPAGTLYVLRREGGERRIGWSISRKHGGAVARNRLRRRLQGAYQDLQQNLEGSADLVLVPSLQAHRQSPAELRATLWTLFQQAGLGPGWKR